MDAAEVLTTSPSSDFWRRRLSAWFCAVLLRFQSLYTLLCLRCWYCNVDHWTDRLPSLWRRVARSRCQPVADYHGGVDHLCRWLPSFWLVQIPCWFPAFFLVLWQTIQRVSWTQPLYLWYQIQLSIIQHQLCLSLTGSTTNTTGQHSAARLGKHASKITQYQAILEPVIINLSHILIFKGRGYASHVMY